MIKCYVIASLNHLDLMHLGDHYFCLAHLYLTNKKYREFFKQIRKKDVFITLDNGAAERSLVTEDKLIEVIKDLLPNEVIAPDILFNKDKTLYNLGSFIDEMKIKGLYNKVDIFGCPQGSTPKEWLDCYKLMLGNPDVKVIGLSKISVPYCWGNRAKNDRDIAKSRQICVKYLIRHDLIKKSVHLLGMGDPREYDMYNHYLIRSTDSCYTILAAANNIKFGVDKFRRITTPNDYFTTKLNKKQIRLAIHNIMYLKKILRGVN